MSTGQNGGSQLKDFAVVPASGNGKPAAHGIQPRFDGTIASACESVGISLKKMIEMLRWATESDPRVAQFLDGWDALDPSERRATGTVESLRRRAGLQHLELIKIAADVMCRLATYETRIIVAVSHPLVVQKTIDLALDDSARPKDSLAAQIVLHKATGFLPMPKGSQTIISVMLNAQSNASVQAPAVSAPSPERTIRTLSERLNEARGLPKAPAPALPERAIGRAFPISIPEDEEGDGE